MLSRPFVARYSCAAVCISCAFPALAEPAPEAHASFSEAFAEPASDAIKAPAAAPLASPTFMSTTALLAPRAVLFAAVAPAAEPSTGSSAPPSDAPAPRWSERFGAPTNARNSSAARAAPEAPPTLAERDESAREAARRRELWMLSVEGVTHAPVDLGLQMGLETPIGLRVFGGLGWVPQVYMGMLTGIAASASGSSSAQAVLQEARYEGKTWHVQLGIRPFRRLGLYADFGYANLSADGELDLSSSGVPALASLGGGYEARTQLDMWLVELGYQGQIANRLVLALALGAMGTFDSKPTIQAVDGAPTSPLLSRAATQADSALESYGIVPTLTLRVGFDLI